jgi:putative endonuclease
MASPSGTLNAGVTGFFERRIMQHKTGALEGFSKKYGCTRLVYYEVYDEVARAMGREKQLKGWRREKKIALIVVLKITAASPGAEKRGQDGRESCCERIIRCRTPCHQ